MNFRADGWSIVLVGRWNPAIFSPAGVVKHVFRLPPATQINVAIPLDGVSAYLVSNPKDTLVVNADHDRVQINIKTCKFVDLIEGLTAGKNILEALPVTPISAVGFNLHYKSTQFEPDVAVLIENEVEKKFRVEGQRIVSNNSTLSLPFQDGQINLTVIVSENETRVSCNFHLGTSDVEKAKSWLSLTEDVIKAELNKIANVLSLSLGERQ